MSSDRVVVGAGDVDEYGMTPVLNAISHCDVAQVTSLVLNGALLNGQISSKATMGHLRPTDCAEPALQHLIRCNLGPVSVIITRVLMTHGANPFIRSHIDNKDAFDLIKDLNARHIGEEVFRELQLRDALKQSACLSIGALENYLRTIGAEEPVSFVAISDLCTSEQMVNVLRNYEFSRNFRPAKSFKDTSSGQFSLQEFRQYDNSNGWNAAGNAQNPEFTVSRMHVSQLGGSQTANNNNNSNNTIPANNNNNNTTATSATNSNPNNNNNNNGNNNGTAVAQQIAAVLGHMPMPMPSGPSSGYADYYAARGGNNSNNNSNNNNNNSSSINNSNNSNASNNNNSNNTTSGVKRERFVPESSLTPSESTISGTTHSSTEDLLKPENLHHPHHHHGHLAHLAHLHPPHPSSYAQPQQYQQQQPLPYPSYTILQNMPPHLQQQHHHTHPHQHHQALGPLHHQINNNGNGNGNNTTTNSSNNNNLGQNNQQPIQLITPVHHASNVPATGHHYAMQPPYRHPHQNDFDSDMSTIDNTSRTVSMESLSSIGTPALPSLGPIDQKHSFPRMSGSTRHHPKHPPSAISPRIPMTDAPKRTGSNGAIAGHAMPALMAPGISTISTAPSSPDPNRAQSPEEIEEEAVTALFNMSKSSAAEDPLIKLGARARTSHKRKSVETDSDDDDGDDDSMDNDQEDAPEDQDQAEGAARSFSFHSYDMDSLAVITKNSKLKKAAAAARKASSSGSGSGTGGRASANEGSSAKRMRRPDDSGSSAPSKSFGQGMMTSEFYAIYPVRKVMTPQGEISVRFYEDAAAFFIENKLERSKNASQWTAINDLYLYYRRFADSLFGLNTASQLEVQRVPGPNGLQFTHLLPSNSGPKVVSNSGRIATSPQQQHSPELTPQQQQNIATVPMASDFALPMHAWMQMSTPTPVPAMPKIYFDAGTNEHISFMSSDLCEKKNFLSKLKRRFPIDKSSGERYPRKFGQRIYHLYVKN